MRRALILLAAALSLTACKLDATVEVNVKPDGSGSIVVTLVADKQLVEQAPGLAEDLRLDDAVNGGWQVKPPVATGEEGLKVVLTHPFATVEEATALLHSISGNGGPLHDVIITRTVTKREVTTGLTGTLRVDGGMDAFADPDLLAAVGGSPYAKAISAAGLRPDDVIEFTFSVALPGKASHPGGATAADQSLTWSVPMDGTTADLSSVAVLVQGTPSSTWGTVADVLWVLLVGWCILAVVLIAVVVRARRNRAMRQSARSR